VLHSILFSFYAYFIQVPHRQTCTSLNSPTLRPSLPKRQRLRTHHERKKTRLLSHKDLRSLHFFSSHRLHPQVYRYCVLVQEDLKRLLALHLVSSDFHGVPLSMRFLKISPIPQQEASMMPELRAPHVPSSALRCRDNNEPPFPKIVLTTRSPYLQRGVVHLRVHSPPLSNWSICTAPQ